MVTTAQLVRVQGEGVGAPLRTDTTAGGAVDDGTSARRGPGPCAPDDQDARRRRIVAAALGVVAEQGLTTTTADDIARRAGCSRATVYRLFPGGKDAVVAAMVEAEAACCLADLGECLAAAPTIGDALVAGIVGAGRFLTGHRVLTRLLADEPGLVLPYLAFEHEERILAFVARWAAPYLARWLDPDTAVRVGEWAARIVDAYCLDPVSAARLTDEAWVRRLVTSTVLPGVEAMARARLSPTGGRADTPTGPPSDNPPHRAVRAVATRPSTHRRPGVRAADEPTVHPADEPTAPSTPMGTDSKGAPRR